MTSAGSLIKEMFAKRQLLFHLITRDMRGRYAGSTLGVLWSLFHPLMLLLLYTTVFSVILNVRFGSSASVSSFGIYLFVGMIPWLAIQDALSRSIHILEENAPLLKQNAFPMILLPTQLVMTALITQCAVTLLTCVIAFHWININPLLLVVFPIALVCPGLMMFGLSLFISTLNPLLKDFGQAVQVLMLIWFFGTPIVYPPSMVPARLSALLNLNPLTHVTAFYRSMLLGEPLPTVGLFLYTLSGTLLIAVAGVCFFARARNIILDSL